MNFIKKILIQVDIALVNPDINEYKRISDELNVKIDDILILWEKYKKNKDTEKQDIISNYISEEVKSGKSDILFLQLFSGSKGVYTVKFKAHKEELFTKLEENSFLGNSGIIQITI